MAITTDGIIIPVITEDRLKVKNLEISLAGLVILS
jgi:hypothetical protein